MNKQKSREYNHEIKKLKKEIKYEEKRMLCCAYSKSDLMYLCGLETRLAELQHRLGELNSESGSVA